MSIIQLDHIDVDFPQKKGKVVKAVSDVTLHVEKGDIYGVVGFSGAGKSTLVRTINLLQHPSKGNIKVNDVDFVKEGKQVISNKQLQLERRKIGMIFQGFNLLNETTVLENVAFALKHAKLSDEELEKRSLELLDLVDLKDKANFYPVELSGGQQQRVVLARTLAQKPEIILADEPVAALDPITAKQVMGDFKRINKEMNISVLINIHHVDLALAYADRVIGIKAGKIVFDGPSDKVDNEVLKEIYGRELESDELMGE